MGNDFKAILTKSSGAISDHLKLSQPFTALVICPLYAVRGNGTNTCPGIKKIYDKWQHRLWASVVCCHRGKAPTEPSLHYYCSWYWFGKTQGTCRSNKPVVTKSTTLGFLCCKSCPPAPRLIPAEGTGSLPFPKQVAGQIVAQSPDQSQVAGGCTSGLPGKLRLQTCTDLRGKFGQRLFNSKYYFLL